MADQGERSSCFEEGFSTCPQYVTKPAEGKRSPSLADIRYGNTVRLTVWHGLILPTTLVHFMNGNAAMARTVFTAVQILECNGAGPYPVLFEGNRIA